MKQNNMLRYSFNCPICNNELKEVHYPQDSYLNEDQWASIRCGDYYCDTCKSDRSRTGYKYYWKKDLINLL
jgi:hypothetical protein